MYELLKTFFHGLIGFIVFWTCVGAATEPSERVITDAPARAVTALNLQWMGVDAPDDESWEAYAAIIAMPREYSTQLFAKLGGEDAKPADWPEIFWWPYDEMPARRPVPEIVRAANLKALTDLEERGFFASLREARKTLRPVRSIAFSDEETMDLVPPQIGDSRRAARHIIAFSWLALDRGDEAEFVEIMRDAQWSAHSINQSALLGSLSCVGIQGLIAREVAWAVRERALSETTLASLDAIMAEMDPIAATRHGFLGVRQSQEDQLQRSYTDDGRGSGYVVLTDEHEELLDEASPFLKVPLRYGGFWAAIPFASRRDNNEVFDRMLAEANAALDAPSIREMRTREAARLEASLNWRYPIARVIYPAYTLAAGNAQEHRAQINATRIIIGIRRHTLAHGQPPATLDALVPAFLAAIPPDTISGKLWVYRTLAQPDADGQRFILYSCGADGTDNGGVHAVEARERLKSGTGKDYVFSGARD